MIQAGERDKRITFSSETTAENSLGEPVRTAYAPLGNRWAQVIYGRGDERRSAAIEGADQTATFNVLSDSLTRPITTKHVIQFDGDVWDIVSIAPWARAEIDFTAIRRTR